jgi:hypothetical protein
MHQNNKKSKKELAARIITFSIQVKGIKLGSVQKTIQKTIEKFTTRKLEKLEKPKRL